MRGCPLCGAEVNRESAQQAFMENAHSLFDMFFPTAPTAVIFAPPAATVAAPIPPPETVPDATGTSDIAAAVAAVTPASAPPAVSDATSPSANAPAAAPAVSDPKAIHRPAPPSPFDAGNPPQTPEGIALVQQHGSDPNDMYEVTFDDGQGGQRVVGNADYVAQQLAALSALPAIKISYVGPATGVQQ